jgi:cathepsin L
MKSAISVDGFVRLASNSYNDLLNAVATVGPVAVSVDASLWSDYSGGIFDECDFS